jgi:copper chaperone CopZ
MKIMNVLISIVVLILTFNAQTFGQSDKTDSDVDQQKTKQVKLKITGMTCGGCANHIHRALSETKGVVDMEVKYPGDSAIITYKPNEIKFEEIIRTIEKSGYNAKKLKS